MRITDGTEHKAFEDMIDHMADLLSATDADYVLLSIPRNGKRALQLKLENVRGRDDTD